MKTISTWQPMMVCGKHGMAVKLGNRQILALLLKKLRQLPLTQPDVSMAIRWSMRARNRVLFIIPKIMVKLGQNLLVFKNCLQKEIGRFPRDQRLILFAGLRQVMEKKILLLFRLKQELLFIRMITEKHGMIEWKAAQLMSTLY